MTKSLNHLKVFVMMAGLTALLGALGQALAGGPGLAFALAFAAISNLAMYFWSSTFVLRMYGARVVTVDEAPGLYRLVDRLRQRAGLPMPIVAVAPQAQPNAFATGRNPSHSVVCVTEGLLETLSEPELEGVIAHELAHIKNRDMLLQTVTATVAGAISNVANMAMFASMFGGRDDDEGSNPIVALVGMIVAPIAATLIQFAISRQREFEADRVGAEISGQPRSLASALEKLEAGAHRIPMAVTPAVAPLAQVNPFGGQGGGLLRLFSTHPPTRERIERLIAMPEGSPLRRVA